MDAIKLLEDGYAEHRENYEWKTGGVNIAGTDATTNINTDSDFTNLFTAVKRAHHVRIESSGTAYFRLNKDTNDKITVTATTPFESDYIIIEKIFCSTNAQAITITIKLS